MPICKNCNNQFPNRMTIDGVERLLNNRSYCLECSPFKEKNGYKLRKHKTKQKRLKQGLGKNTKQCPICNKIFKWNSNNVCQTCRCKYRRHKNKLKLIKILGGKCTRCGESNYKCLQFHHMNPDNKKFLISGALHKNIQELKKEANKCELLCANCHQIEHHTDITEIEKYYSE